MGSEMCIRDRLGSKREARITVTDAEQGLDIVVEGIRPSPALFARLATAGPSLGAARITVDGESLALRGTPTVALSGVEVSLPAGAFLQAARESEAVLAGLVKRASAARSGSPTSLPALAPSPSRSLQAPKSMPSKRTRRPSLLWREQRGQRRS